MNFFNMPQETTNASLTNHNAEYIHRTCDMFRKFFWNLQSLKYWDQILLKLTKFEWLRPKILEIWIFWLYSFSKVLLFLLAVFWGLLFRQLYRKIYQIHELSVHDCQKLEKSCLKSKHTISSKFGENILFFAIFIPIHLIYLPNFGPNLQKP